MKVLFVINGDLDLVYEFKIFSIKRLFCVIFFFSVVFCLMFKVVMVGIYLFWISFFF